MKGMLPEVRKTRPLEFVKKGAITRSRRNGLYSEVVMCFNDNEHLILFLAALYGCPLPFNHISL